MRERERRKPEKARPRLWVPDELVEEREGGLVHLDLAPLPRPEVVGAHARHVVVTLPPHRRLSVAAVLVVVLGSEERRKVLAAHRWMVHEARSGAHPWKTAPNSGRTNARPEWGGHTRAKQRTEHDFVGGHATSVVHHELDIREVVILELLEQVRRKAPRADVNGFLDERL